MKLQTLKPRLSQLVTIRLQPQAQEVQRLRGGNAVKRRAQYLDRHPLCVKCQAEGRTAAATVPDHIIPLWAGGADDLDANGQALCKQHHDPKTACEARMRAAGGWMATACNCGQHG